MVTCPWCGTAYEGFISNCKNCGGPMLPPHEEAAPGPLIPPPAPRSIAGSYAGRLMVADGASIAGFVLALLGGIFTAVGMGLTLGVVTAFVGIPFFIMGVVIFAGGAAVLLWRYQEKRKVVEVLRNGEAILGEVADLNENVSVRVNGEHLWTVEYRFRAQGQTYVGKVTTLREPGEELRRGKPVYVLYTLDDPTVNAIYPHP